MLSVVWRLRLGCGAPWAQLGQRGAGSVSAAAGLGRPGVSAAAGRRTLVHEPPVRSSPPPLPAPRPPEPSGAPPWGPAPPRRGPPSARPSGPPSAPPSGRPSARPSGRPSGPPPTPPSGPSVLLVDGRPVARPDASLPDPGAELLRRTAMAGRGGVYTVLRVLRGGRAVLGLSLHAERLLRSAGQALSGGRSGGGSGSGRCRQLETMQPEVMEALLRDELRAGLDLLGEDVRAAGIDFQATVMLDWAEEMATESAAGRGFRVTSLLRPIPFRAPTAAVGAAFAQRRSPSVKDLCWVAERDGLLARRQRDGLDEILLCDAGGGVTEGLQSNFFAVTGDGVLVTAPASRVLLGSVRSAVLRAAAMRGMQVRFACPRIEETWQWESCFISSSSRLAQPIHRLELLSGSGLSREFETRSSAASLLSMLVRQDVEDSADVI